MATFTLETFIAAPPEVCFDLSLDLDLHQGSMDHTGEKIVGGRPAGRIGLYEFVTWEAKHFGIRQRMTVGITALERPHRFQDQMLKGAFKRFEHEHVFEAVEGGTLMRDTFDLCGPLAPLSWLPDRWILVPHMRALMLKRNALIKQMAESRQSKSAVLDSQ
ncbi:MAG TPA: SRPBCC family protein [Holophagaceae bacterium]|jgi:ligand-binding SRPBCC domain-containing protein|nr:SRPBCC family protein [Holophagaceae bacterium]